MNHGRILYVAGILYGFCIVVGGIMGGWSGAFKTAGAISLMICGMGVLWMLIMATEDWLERRRKDDES